MKNGSDKKFSQGRSKWIRNKINKLSGYPIEYDLCPYQKYLSEIKKMDFSRIKDAELIKRSIQLQDRVLNGTDLNDILIEAFALVKEASRRIIRLDPFDVQTVAGIALHFGKLTELQTGEGKTLAAVFPAYLNALNRQGVHILTFNDYLARRDKNWMGPVFQFLGLSVDCIQEGMDLTRRKKAYAANITYATAKQAGFDFLRDQLCYTQQDLVQRPFHFAIIDEADSIMIDEARVPLIIAGSTLKTKAYPARFAGFIKTLKPELHYQVDEGRRNIYLTEEGVRYIESSFNCHNLYAEENLDLLTKINCALHAENLLQRDIDYIIRNNKIEIVDEFTGRVVKDRHWPDGLQAALETKENLQTQPEGRILGSITLQHFLQLYPKLSGMTATAQSAAHEFKQFYGLKVVVIPPNKPCVREDLPDKIFTHKEAKTKALVEEIRRNHTVERPVLVGTRDIEESEQLAEELIENGINCTILNAKNDEKEAGIVAQAGYPGAVTISTNMAGRGTDIKLGGELQQRKKEVEDQGGLYVIGTNRHESVRIDNQLRGRAGRQGDPGSSCFFISLEDDLFERYGFKKRLFSSFRLTKQDLPLNIPMLQRDIIHGQRCVEGENFEIRKTLWKYSWLIETQRKLIQGWRREIFMDEKCPDILRSRKPELYQQFTVKYGEERLKEIEKKITLYHIDQIWADHLAYITDIRESIHLENVGGKTPIIEFQKKITAVFINLEEDIKGRVIETFIVLNSSKEPIDLEKMGIKGPSSTWTYLINDDQFGNWMELLKGRNIGYAAGAIYLYPVLFLYGIYLYFKNKKKKTEQKIHLNNDLN